MASTQASRVEFIEGTWIASDSEKAVANPANLDFDFTHSMGTGLAGSTIRREHLIQPSDKPTLVRVNSTVETVGVAGLNSPQYLASIRRRKSIKIKNMFQPLAKKARLLDFELFTLGLVEEIRELLSQLREVHREGNTREILRLVRDTFLDGGHERYRDAKARYVVATIFERLSEADEVILDEVDRVWDELYDSGLSARMPAVFVAAHEKEQADD